MFRFSTWSLHWGERSREWEPGRIGGGGLGGGEGTGGRTRKNGRKEFYKGGNRGK